MNVDNRLDFSKSIEITSDSSILDWFNEVMVLFNLVNKYDIKSVKGTVGESIISFDVEFNKLHEAKEASNIMVLNELTIYDELYSLNNTRKRNTVNVSLLKL